MSFRVKGPHTFTLGYKPGYSTPDQVLPGEVLPVDTPVSDLLNLARNNNLTDDNDGIYNVRVNETTGSEELVKVTKDKNGNPVETPVSDAGVVTGQPSEDQIRQTANEADGTVENVVGA